MQNPPRLFAAWFVYETVLPLARQDGWLPVEHRTNPRDGHRETKVLDLADIHRPTEFQLGAFGRFGYWFVMVELGRSSPTWGVVDPESKKTFMITPYRESHFGRPITYSLPGDDRYTYPGEYVTSC